MKFKILTIFPDMLRPMVSESILGRAQAAGLISIDLIDIRAYAENKHRNTDDYPFGGGAGMVMLPQPIVDAMAAASLDLPHARRIYLSPKGAPLTQQKVEALAKEPGLIMLCGHYEGVDQRAIDMTIDEEISIGDYVLTGGELGALVITDAVSRLIPGVLGGETSAEDESFSSGLLEYPQYTRPRSFRGQDVPEVLVNGNHAAINRWRRNESLRITAERRPELLEHIAFDKADRAYLREIGYET